MNEVLEHIKDKLTDSSNYYHELTARKKRDMEVYSGNFWTDEMMKMCDRRGRLNTSFTQYSKFANAITSPYSKSPWHAEIDNRSGRYNEIQELIDKFENDNDAKFIFSTALKQACVTGTGFFVLSINDDVVKPELVRDVSQVALDPNILELDASDAEFGAIVSHIAVSKAKRLYGKDVVDFKGNTLFDNIGEQWTTPSDSIHFISFYELNEDGQVELTKVCGNKIVYETTTLPFDRIPIYRICFNEVIRSDKVDYNGIVDMTKDLMLAQSIAFSTMMERANRSPKANYMMEVSQLDGLDEFYKRLNTKESLVCLYNGDKVSTPPVPITESYQTADLQATIDSTCKLMEQVIGVPIGGIQPANTTATEILVQQTNSESNVESLYNNASKAVRSMTKTLLNALCWEYELEVPSFKLINGPEVIRQNDKLRLELNAISGLLTDEKSRKILAKHYIDTFDAETRDALEADIIANSDDVIYLSDAEQLNIPNIIAENNRMKQQLDMQQQQLDELSNAAEELKQANDELNMQILSNKESSLIEAQKLKNDYDIQMMKLNLEQQKVNNDTTKVNSQANKDLVNTQLSVAKANNELVNQVVRMEENGV